MSVIRGIYDDYVTFRDDTVDWRRQRDKMRKFYFGQQYSTDQSSKWEERGWVDIVINKIRPLIRTRVSMLIASKPQGKVYGVRKDDISTALALEELLDWHWYKCDGQLLAEDVNMGAQREGVADFVLYYDSKLDYGRGELVIDSDTYEHVFVDKASRRWDYRDSRRVIHTKLVRPEDFMARNPAFKGDINNYLHSDDMSRWSGKAQHKDKAMVGFPDEMADAEFVREFDSYERVYREVPLLHYIPTGTIMVLDDNYTITDEDNELIKKGIIREAKAPVPRIKWIKCIANTSKEYQIGRTQWLPISDYPIIPIHDERTGNSESLGEVDFQAGLQELLNKSAALVLLNAALGSLFKMVVDAGKAGITDLTKFRSDWAAPGGVHNIPIDPVTGKFPFEIVRPEPLNQAFFMWMEKMGQEIEYEISTFSMRMGDPSKAPETYAATLQLGEWSQDILRIPLNHWEIGLQRMNELLLQWSPYVYSFYKSFEVGETFREEPDTQFINAPYPMQGIVSRSTGETIATMHDIANVRAKYRIRSGSTMPSMATAHMMLYGELSKTDPYWRKWLVDYLPIKEKQTIKQELDQMQGLQSQNQQLQQALKVTQGELERIYNEIISKDKQIEMTQFKSDLERILTEFKANLKVDREKAKSKRITK